MSDIVLGLVGADYVLVACDQNVGRSIVVYKHNEDKITQVDNNKVIGCGGPVGDRTHFCEFIEKNAALYSLRHGLPLSTHALAEFTRLEIAEALRKGPYQCNLLIGGCDEKHGPELYWCDYLGALTALPFGAHGYGSYFALSIFDRFYKKKMSLSEGFDCVSKVIVELQHRFLINFGPILIKVAKKDSIEKYIINVAENKGKVEVVKEEKKVERKEEEGEKKMDIDSK